MWLLLLLLLAPAYVLQTDGVLMLMVLLVALLLVLLVVLLPMWYIMQEQAASQISERTRQQSRDMQQPGWTRGVPNGTPAALVSHFKKVVWCGPITEYRVWTRKRKIKRQRQRERERAKVASLSPPHQFSFPSSCLCAARTWPMRARIGEWMVSRSLWTVRWIESIIVRFFGIATHRNATPASSKQATRPDGRRPQPLGRRSSKARSLYVCVSAAVAGAHRCRHGGAGGSLAHLCIVLEGTTRMRAGACRSPRRVPASSTAQRTLPLMLGVPADTERA